MSALDNDSVRRFMAKVNTQGPIQQHMQTPCWEWTASRNEFGYGTFAIARKSKLAHRVAWIIFKGSIPSVLPEAPGRNDLVRVCHRCDFRACVNPEHLFLGSQMDNARDCARKKRINYAPSITAIAAKRRAQTCCKRGHLFDEANTYITSKGFRSCRACLNAYKRNKRNGATW